MDYQQGPPSPPSQPVPNYLVHAILATLFCCLPFGIVAIVYAAQVNSALAVGNYEVALEASNKARTWSTVALIVGLVVVLLCITVSALGLVPFLFGNF